MKVKVYPHMPGRYYGNIYWTKAGDPDLLQAVPTERPATSFGDASVESLRKRGYFVSCFPEGDGILWEPLQGQSHEQCLQDIRECFVGWDATWGKSPEQWAREDAQHAIEKQEAQAQREALDLANKEADARAALTTVTIRFAGPVKWTPVLKGLLNGFAMTMSAADSTRATLRHVDDEELGPDIWDRVLERLIGEVGVEPAMWEGCAYLNMETELMRVSEKLRARPAADTLLFEMLNIGDRVVELRKLIELAVALNDGHNLLGRSEAVSH